MPCDTRLKPNQTISQRAEEIRKVTAAAISGLSQGRIKAKVGPQGAITFTGLGEAERDGVTDNCLYRRLMASGSALVKQSIARAEALAGRSIDRQVVAQGGHYHGDVYHEHKG